MSLASATHVVVVVPRQSVKSADVPGALQVTADVESPEDVTSLTFLADPNNKLVLDKPHLVVLSDGPQFPYPMLELVNSIDHDPAGADAVLAELLGKARPARRGQSDQVIVRELAQDARSWASSRGGVNSRPGGLLAQAGGVAAGEQPPGNAPIERFIAAAGDEWRQIPHPVEVDSVDQVNRATGLDFLEGDLVMFGTSLGDRKLKTDQPQYLGLRVPGAGILGPVEYDPAADVFHLIGFLPAKGRVQILVWAGPEPDPKKGELVGTVSIPSSWNPSEESLVLDWVGRKASLSAEPTGLVDEKIIENLVETSRDGDIVPPGFEPAPGN